MLIANASRRKAGTKDPELAAILARVSERALRQYVEAMAYPRHYVAQPEANRRCAAWIAEQFRAAGLQPKLQGRFGNVVAISEPDGRPLALICAHFDSVPTTPGADDNASAVAGMLACADILARVPAPLRVGFVAFNREEDGLMGSADFVASEFALLGDELAMVHVLEMIGYCRNEPGSQARPPGLPIPVPDVGSFIAVLGNRKSNHLVDHIVDLAASQLADLPMLGLKVHFVLEGILPVLCRSDHAPFWEAGVAATMWTDMAEFRNPNYHQPTDTPDTLDYGFLRLVTQLVLASVLRPGI